VHQWIPDKEYFGPGWEIPIAKRYARKKPKDSWYPNRSLLEAWRDVRRNHKNQPDGKPEQGRKKNGEEKKRQVAHDHLIENDPSANADDD
jgi:hypothetical protein